MEKLIVSVGPHIKDKVTIAVIMQDVVIALLPAMAASFWLFGWLSVKVIAFSVIGALGSTLICQKLRKKKFFLDKSSLVTGVLLAFVLPPSVPWWIPVIGGACAIILGKEIFGGLGHNIFNPALVGRAILLASWPAYLTAWISPFDGVSCATPLGIIKEGLPQTLPSYRELFLGIRGGCLGETSVLALLIGAGYLLWRRRIDWRIPFAYLTTVTVISLVTHQDPLFHLMAGGLILGAFFMATDYVTSPTTPWGRIIFGVGCGIMTMLIRLKGGFPEGVSYSILIMNMFVPLLDRFIRPKPFGQKK